METPLYRWTAVMAALALASCDKPATSEVPEPEPPTPTATVKASQSPPPSVASVPTPAIGGIVPAPVSSEEKPAQRIPPPLDEPTFAPPGVYYLVAATNIPTKDGVIGVRAGQEVTKIGNGVYSADGHKLTLKNDQVTNYLPTVRKIVARNAQADAALARVRAAPATPEPVAQVRRPFILYPRQPERIPSSTPFGTGISVTPLTGPDAVHDRVRRTPRWFRDIYGYWHFG